MISFYSPPASMGTVMWAGVALLLSIISYFSLPSSKQTLSSRKARQAKLMKEAYKNMEKEESSRNANVQKETSCSQDMHISKLLIYPIKSIQGCEVQSALLTREGFHLDRRFMLLRSHPSTPTTSSKLENMHISRFPSMCLLHTSISSSNNTLTISYTPPANPPAGLASSASSIEIPLEPESFEGLETVEVSMHSSPTTAFNMGARCNDWFTSLFGFPVVLVFWGLNPRLVLGNLPFQPKNVGPKSLSRSPITKVLSSLPILGPLLTPEDEGVIAFNDCAPYLVISDSSVTDVSARLPENTDMDLTKFRPNIVVKGSQDAYAEDFWSELTFSPPSTSSTSSTSSASNPTTPKILLTGNCGRCASLNVDYATGCPLSDPSTQPLKLLQKDRRVDPGIKYSPIFGRYGFVSKSAEGSVVRVGDRVDVSGRNEERTRFYWPGLST